jgi:hypothetical protein
MRRLTIILALSLAVAAVAAQSAFAATGGWTAASVPPLAGNVDLQGASALNNSDAWAVGAQIADAEQPPAPAVAYHWNGTTWSLTPTPNLGVAVGLESVSASSPTDAWAVGGINLGPRDHGTLIEHWNGSTWSVAQENAETGQGVQLDGVVGLSSTDAWAVGDSSGLVEHWNGKTWRLVTLPDPSFTPAAGQAISAVSAKNLWILGFTVNSATGVATSESLHFNGTSWTAAPLQQPNATNFGLNSLSAISAKDIWAVGQVRPSSTAANGSTLIEHYNGTAWSIVPSPTPGFDPTLTGVAGRSATDAYAVGNELPSANGGPEQALILRWDGKSWSQDSDGKIGGSPIAAATFPGADTEWAVGISSSEQGLILSHP